jgi:hypothetical protein
MLLRKVLFCIVIGTSCIAKADLLIKANEIPLTKSDGWKVLSFKKIPKSDVQFLPEGLLVGVQKSAGPLVYKLPAVTTVNEITVAGKIEGALKSFGKKHQGEKGQDDFLLRVGLVVPGNKRLNFWQKKIAPEWVLTLHGLAEKNQGVKQIDFFNLVSDRRILNTERRHPLSDLLYEHNVWWSDSADFNLRHTLPAPLPVIGLWLSLDGDDTGSQFKVLLKSLRLD